jgi:hypothetical protein
MGFVVIKLSGQSSKNAVDNIAVKYTGLYSDYWQPVYCERKEVDNLSGTLPYFDFSQNDKEQFRSQRGFYLGAVYSVIKNPTFRPNGGEEIVVSQTASSPGFLAGYQYDITRFGFGARAIYWHASFQNFAFEEMPGSPFPVYLKYTDPAFSHFSIDLLVEWIATKKFYVGIYGLLGLASSTERYNISGSTFPEWNGQKSLSEFDYSYGLGIKISPLKIVSIIAEIRWIPGDETQDLIYLYSSGGYDYFKAGDRYTTNFTTIFSAGLSFNFGIFRSKDKIQK